MTRQGLSNQISVYTWITSQNVVFEVPDFLTAVWPVADSKVVTSSPGGALWTFAELSQDFWYLSSALDSRQRNSNPGAGEHNFYVVTRESSYQTVDSSKKKALQDQIRHSMSFNCYFSDMLRKFNAVIHGDNQVYELLHSR